VIVVIAIVAIVAASNRDGGSTIRTNR
jgi:hypothetical protein